MQGCVLHLGRSVYQGPGPAGAAPWMQGGALPSPVHHLSMPRCLVPLQQHPLQQYDAPGSIGSVTPATIPNKLGPCMYWCPWNCSCHCRASLSQTPATDALGNVTAPASCHRRPLSVTLPARAYRAPYGQATGSAGSYTALKAHVRSEVSPSPRSPKATLVRLGGPGTQRNPPQTRPLG